MTWSSATKAAYNTTTSEVTISHMTINTGSAAAISLVAHAAVGTTSWQATAVARDIDVISFAATEDNSQEVLTTVVRDTDLRSNLVRDSSI